MNTTDLMIGDYFQTTYPNGKIEYRKVTAVTEGCVSDNNGITTIVEPIPLTPEILEKNEIKLQSVYKHPYSDYEWEEGELEEVMKHYPMYVYSTQNRDIEFVIRPDAMYFELHSFNYETKVEKRAEVIYVHEFQRALRLCNINKKIVL